MTQTTLADTDKLRCFLGDARIDAAEALLAQGGSVEIRSLQEGRVVTGLVHSPTSRTERVYIQQSLHGIDGECSCEDAFNCVHVAVVLVHALQQVVAENCSAVSRSATGASTGRMPREAVPMQQLYYLLEPSAQQDRSVAQICQLILSLYVGHVDDRGEMTAQRFNARPGPDGSFPRYVHEDEKPIVQGLQEISRDSHYLLQGTKGAAVLRHCLGTGRCHFGDFSHGPLTAAADIPLAPQWTLRLDGRQQLQMGLADAALLALALEPPLYIDTASYTWGGLSWSGEIAVLRDLSTRPLLLGEGVPALNRSLLDRPFPVGIPLAADLPVVPTPLSSVRARLSLAALETQAAAHLRYRINGVALCDPAVEGARASVRYVDRGAVQEVERDVSAESALQRELEDLGFASGRRTQGPGEPEYWLALPDDNAWLNFMLRHLPALEQSGWEVEISENFPYRLATAGEWYGDLAQHLESEKAGGDWFSLELGVLIDGERVNLLPLLAELLSGTANSGGNRPCLSAECVEGHWLLPLSEGRYLPVSRSRIDGILDTMVELYESSSLGDGGQLPLPINQLGRIAQLEADVFSASDSDLHWAGSQELRELAEKLAHFESLGVTPVPPELNASLRPYQQTGLDWLQFLADYRLGGILADDMGLGKTIQTLAHLLTEKSRGRLRRPALVVAPTSVLPNWRQETERFAPGLNVLVLHGPRRSRQFAAIPRADLVLTTYPLLGYDAEVLLAQEYSVLVLDEAQAIKNPRTRAARLVRELRAEHRLCLTGTPMENHLGELWSLFDFLLPGLLGSEQQFQRLYRRPIERGVSAERGAALSRRIAPFFLRRTKDEVAPELPPKTEIMRAVPLGEEQLDLYESIRLTMHKQIRQVIHERGLERSQIAVLDALLKLRQVCCDPRLLPLETARGVTASAKLELLLSMLPELVEEGRRILLFSQFTSMLSLIESAVQALGISSIKLTGESRDRGTLVERFQSGEVPLFLISLKAGGTGLNLTAADTVIHYDPWWNPAVEAQATDRAHRIGQDKPVFVYKLFIEGSVEEKILALQAQKRSLASSILGAGSTSGGSITQRDLAVLFEPLTTTA
jgi:hypothetical protein